MAVFGLGANSPVSLQLTRENFNALIGRHGQYVRWLSSNKCPCIGTNGRVDENCSFCSGTGVSYTNIDSSEDILTATVIIDGVVELPENDGIIWIKDSKGNDLTIVGTCDEYATVPGVKKGETVTVKYVESVKDSGAGTATFISSGLYKVDLSLDVDFGTVQGSLLSIIAYNDTQDVALTVTNIFRNFFETEETTLETDVVSVSYEYIEPFNFAILNQNLGEMDKKFLVDNNGDSIMTFPQRWPVSEDDIIVALNSSTLKNHVYRASGGEVDTLPSFYIFDLESAYSIRSDEKHEFIPDTDFIIYKGNTIKWLTANRPTASEQVSINYSFNITYRVLKDIPQPRTSENNRFPRKVGLKVYTDFNKREGF